MGSLWIRELVESVGNLSFEDSLELNAKLNIIESITVKESNNKLKLLMMLLDQL